MDIGKRIEELLKIRGYKRKDLSAKLGVSEAVVSQWIKGSKIPTVKHLVDLSALLDCTLDYLIKGDT